MNLPSMPVYHFALTGYPLGHSLSPAIHNAALKSSGLAGEYTLRPIPPERIPDGLDELVSDLRCGALHGLNVTIPHKQAVLPLCDELTSYGTAIGAINLLYHSDGKIIGDNSDARGFLAALRGYEGHWRHRRALILGAGGSARAVAYGLASSGWDLTVASRRPEQAYRLVEELILPLKVRGAAASYPIEKREFQGIDLVVNTTPLGMHPHPDGCPWPVSLPLPDGAVIYDLVYNPRSTSLLRLAERQGHPVIGGITMLIEQAAIAFERWTGREAPIQAMKDAVG